jgi:hypothetical protein
MSALERLQQEHSFYGTWQLLFEIANLPIKAATKTVPASLELMPFKSAADLLLVVVVVISYCHDSG